jgi:two-component SAPR family response regulator
VDRYKTFSRILDPYILGDIVDSYLRLGETAKAREAFSKIDTVRDIIDETPNLQVDYLTIRGSLETDEGKFQEALVSLKDALRKARSIDKYYISMITCYKLSKCYYRQGAHERALTYFKKCLEIARHKGYEAYLSLEARDSIDLFKLALENDCMVEYALHILESVESEQAKDLLNWMQIERGLYDLECRVLGKLVISDTQGRIMKPDWRTKNTEQLFFLFIAGHKRKYSKDELVDIFWPKKNLHEAAHSLHVEISALRSALKGVLRSDFATQRIVIFANGQYYLNPKIYVRTDVQRFQQLANQARASLSQNRGKAKQLFNQALDLYRGDFCEGIYADWCDEIRSYYRKSVVDILKKLGDIHFEDQAFQTSLEFLYQALKLDDTDESVHIAVMRCLQAVNDKDGIQRQYKKLVKTLNRMGISVPSHEATDIYQNSLR